MCLLRCSGCCFCVRVSNKVESIVRALDFVRAKPGEFAGRRDTHTHAQRFTAAVARNSFGPSGRACLGSGALAAAKYRRGGCARASLALRQGAIVERRARSQRAEFARRRQSAESVCARARLFAANK